MTDAFVWHPPQSLVDQANLTQFIKENDLDNFDHLLSAATANSDWFWNAILARLMFYLPFTKLRDESRGIPFTKWCVGGQTNVALNCLDRYRSTPVWNKDAIIFESEAGVVERWTYQRLTDEVDALAAGLRAIGCGRGQVVGIYLPNLPQAIASILAVAKIGAVALPLFSGFGAAALASRLSDAGATTVITADGTSRRGRLVPLKATLDEAAAQLPDLARVVVLQSGKLDCPFVPGRDHDYQELVLSESGDRSTEVLEAEHPLMLMYTSGTTGKPKGTVHSHVGFLAKLILDMELMLDLKPSDRLLWISDMGWLVGPIIAVGTTLIGATMLIVEGGPDYPDPGRLWRLIDEHQLTFLGMAPTIARAFIKSGGGGIDQRDLSSLRVLASTGEAWTPEAWHWVFEKVCRRRVPILNYSGGTEVGGGILCGSVLHRMKPCAFTTCIPGMSADVVDELGRSLPADKVGELVLRDHSIGLSRSLWNDDERYLQSYWEKIPGVWCQGDWTYKDSDGYWYILGRSDDTLKIAGKRTGPSEIEELLTGTGKVAEAAAIGIPDPVKGQSVGCVVVLMPDVAWSDQLAKQLEAVIIDGLGAPYRPSFIIPVADLPKTRNMKVMRRVIRAACLQQDPGDLTSIVNPETLDAIAQATAEVRQVGSKGDPA
ncbi:AMP-binding protein [Nitratireductor sp. XY-223]|uniref:AMP-binding protein n=1 Tax=Nitratireductor sp. XY-223 TaxID=2561926 RepID=UPI0010AA221B|nr:AMP-binding protein [Nitratireductor sp. XY-223]